MKKKNLELKSFLSALIVIFILMCSCYALTLILPGGEYTRILDTSGNEIIDTSVPFTFVEGGLPFYKFILSPILVLTMSGSGTTIAILIFLFVIGGIFKCLEESGIMKYFLEKTSYNYAKSRYDLLKILSLFFMLMGTLMGSCEEIIPLVPIVVSLTTSLGFDAMTGLGISILAGSCGFSSGVANPFTIGLAHRLAGLPMFSGAWYRIIIFITIYIVLMFFIIRHAKKIAKDVDTDFEFVKNERLDKATKAFAIAMGIGLICVILSSVITILQDYTMIIVALMFLVGGIIACFIAEVPFKVFMNNFKDGALSIAPAALSILMASSIKYILTEGKILDTILYYLISCINGLPRWAIILFVYLIFLIMEVFIASGSAKAFLLMPLILPIAQICNISSRLAILSFAFGDGFSNVIYPTNAGLLISLSLADSSFKDWFRYSWKFFLLNFILTCLFLVAGLYIGY